MTLAAGLACASVVLAACSSSNSNDTAQSPADSTASAPAAAQGSGGSSGSATANASAPADALSMTEDQACQTASMKDGGTLNYWTATDPDVFAQEIAPFEQQNPSIKVNYTSLRDTDITQRLVTEVQAHHTLDVDAIAGSLPAFAPLFDQKLITDVDWSKLGVAADLQFQLKGYTTIRTYREVLGLGYNTDLVKPEDLPNSWQDLINSKWAGKIIADPRGIYLSGLALGMGQDQAQTWFKNFMATDKPQIVKGATASMEKVISGEALLTTSSHDSESTEQQKKGAPIGIKYLDIVPTQDWYALIPKGAPHAAAAMCFFGWWTSAEGQAQQLKYEFKTDVTNPPGLPAGAKLVAVNTPDDAKTAADAATVFAKLMGGS
jgi:iron(III) transport system substrate-binding protein